MNTEKYQHKLLIDAEEVAERLSIKKTLFYRLHSEGRIPEPIRLGGRVLWSNEELEAWVRAGSPDRMEWNTMK